MHVKLIRAAVMVEGFTSKDSRIPVVGNTSSILSALTVCISENLPPSACIPAPSPTVAPLGLFSASFPSSSLSKFYQPSPPSSFLLREQIKIDLEKNQREGGWEIAKDG